MAGPLAPQPPVGGPGDPGRDAPAARSGPAGIRPQLPDDVLGMPVADAHWFTRVDPRVTLDPGAFPDKVLRVPVATAQRLLQAAAREAAELPSGAAAAVVFTSGTGELIVHTDAMTLACAPGLVTIAVPVGCDQLPRGGSVTVPLGVGTEQKPAGLVMSTVDRPGGPAVVVDGWGPALTAFAWHALLRLTQALCAATGSDTAGDPLVPAYVGATTDILLVAPMARHRPPIVAATATARATATRVEPAR